MPKFTNQEAVLWLSPPGDRILRIIGIDKGLSTGAKTNGCTQWRLKLFVEPTVNYPGSNMNETLIDHESLHWKWDCMLKSCGVKMELNEEYTFDADEAAQENKRHINLIGLRGWATISYQEPKVTGDKPKYNQVAAWITNKEKLDRYVPEGQSNPDSGQNDSLAGW